jgi:hypothetical protein
MQVRCRWNCIKTNFGVFSACGAENPKIGFIIGIATLLLTKLPYMAQSLIISKYT